MSSTHFNLQDAGFFTLWCVITGATGAIAILIDGVVTGGAAVESVVHPVAVIVARRRGIVGVVDAIPVVIPVRGAVAGIGEAIEVGIDRIISGGAHILRIANAVSVRIHEEVDDLKFRDGTSRDRNVRRGR